MLDLISHMDPAGCLVFIAATLQTVAHVFKNQLLLRATLLTGTFFYIAYYFLVASEPLWPAILGSSMIAITNVFGYLRIATMRFREKFEWPECHSLNECTRHNKEYGCILYGVRLG